jgi:predicted secreted protein
MILFCILLLTAGTLTAGDIAVFNNLGFSPDGRYFMFSQHGIEEKTSSSYADLFLVNVATNRFVPGGAKRLEDSRPVGPGNIGQGALYTLLENTLPLKKQYKIDHILTGRLLYILLDGEDAKPELSFRDFQTGTKYLLRLIQSVAGSGKEVKSSFHLLVTVETSASLKNYTVGLPDYRRRKVKRYRIKQVILGPDEKNLVFVMEKEEQDTTGDNIRYMVETLQL